MKITRSADWRDALTFDVPLRAADVAPGEPARCAACPADIDAHERSELWAVKHRHPTNPAGFVRFYCAAHTPAAPAAPAMAAASRPAGRARGARRESAPRRESVPARAPQMEITRATCPDCFVEVSATGDCGVCGQRVG